MANLTAHLAEHPDDAEGYYRLGRVHSLAFTLKRGWIEAFERQGEPPDPAPDWMQRADEAGKTAKPLNEDALLHHLTEAVRSYSRAIELAPDKGDYRLGMASVLEAGAAMSERIPVAPTRFDEVANDWEMKRTQELIERLGQDDDAVDRAREIIRQPAYRWTGSAPRETLVRALLDRREEDGGRGELIRRLLEEDWQEQITEFYFEAFSLALVADSKLDEQPLRGVSELTAYEAGRAYRRLVAARGARDDEKVRLSAVAAALKAFDRLPENRAITPIVFSLDAPHALKDLLSPNTTVLFDLDGDDAVEPWPWVAPTTGILVWDPAETGTITSGRQLFGSVTWWIFFDNGYQALDALDDTRDGKLTGDELRGLAVWFDRDSDGVSDPGEVIPVGRAGIESLSTRVTTTADGCPANASGVRLTGGRTLPTYDWIASPAGALPGSSPAATAVSLWVSPLLACTLVLNTTRRWLRAPRQTE